MIIIVNEEHQIKSNQIKRHVKNSINIQIQRKCYNTEIIIIFIRFKIYMINDIYLTINIVYCMITNKEL